MSKYDEIDFEKVALHMQKQVETDPNNVQLRNELAIVFMEINQYEEAFFQLQAAAELKPSIQTLYNLGYFYFAEGKPIVEDMESRSVEEDVEEEEMSYTWEIADKEAFTIVEDILKHKPRHHFPYNVMGEMYIKKEKYEEAIGILEEAITLTPSLENLNNLGLCYYKKGRLSEAAECFRKAHLLRSSNNDSLFPFLSYGICLAHLGRESEAKEAAKELLTLSRKEGEDLEADIAEIYYILEDYEEVVNIYCKLDWEFYSEEFFPTYFHSLWKLSKTKQIEELASKTIQRKEKEMQEVLQDPDEEEEFKVEYKEVTKEEIAFIKNTVKEVYWGKAPIVKYEPTLETRCYLYGCFRHTDVNPSYFSI
ncbi:tetratricopeptide repeat protein [Priestia aryabhattai]|uniref:tetratricopeptide repeat protein n=1 Tax=Priestia aryabhattai TaxID=412384 RepID=UPI001C8E5543|nr:tetratricopeptide repeat protein [Priestia aryabhattai]MBY0064413.1 tetratricopeptide repeat protein [Priestia aryabhattai]